MGEIGVKRMEEKNMQNVKNKFDWKGNTTDSKKEMEREYNRITEITTIDSRF